MNKIVVFIYLLLSPFFVLAAKGNGYVIRSVSVDDGLSSSAVLSLCQDKNGLMWFGTYDGLNCYDGKNVHVFRSKADGNSDFFLKSNIINGIYPADNDCFWIQSNRELSRFSLLTHKVEDSFNLGLSGVFSNKSGNTWLQKGDSLCYYNTRQKRFVDIASVKESGYRHFFVADNGNLWAISNRSTYVDVYTLDTFEAEGGTSARLTQSRFQLHDRPIVEFYLQSNTFCFIDEDDNLYFHDMERKTNIFIRNISRILQRYGRIENISTLQDDIIIAFHLNGLIKLDADNNYEEMVIDRSVRIFKIYKDVSNNILWIGTDGQGIMMLMEDNSIARTIALSDLSPYLKRQVRTISTDKYGGLWFGTKGDGLIYLPSFDHPERGVTDAKIFSNMEEQPLSEYTPWMKDVRVFGLKESRFHDGMWIGGSGFNVLSFYSFKRKGFIPMRGLDGIYSQYEIHGFYEESDSVLWISLTGVGLVRMTMKVTENGFDVMKLDPYPVFTPDGIRLTVFFAMENSVDDVLWLGDRGHGLIRFSLKDKTYRTYSLEEKLHKPVNDILSIYPADDGRLYIGTTAGLVTAVFDGEELGKVEYLGLEEGLSNDMLHGVRADASGLIWMSTNEGLQKFNPSNGNVHSFYGRGIKIREFSDGAFYRCPYTGRLFFGGVNGLLYLHEVSKELSVQKFRPNIIVRYFHLDDRRSSGFNYFKDQLGGWKFSSDYGIFAFDFITPDYMFGQDIEYSYKLEGYDKTWSRYSKKNSAMYSKVPAGKYTFKIRYKCDVDDEDHSVKSVPVYIYDKWYDSFWFRMVLGLLLGVVVVVLLKRWREKIIADYVKAEEVRTAAEKVAESAKKERTMVRYNTTFRFYSIEQQDFVDRLIVLIETSIGKEELGISFLASELCMSTRQFYRKFNEVAPDALPGDLIKECRLEKAAELLRTTKLSIQDVSIAIGFNSRSYFYKEFVKKYGLTPKDFRNVETGT